MSPQKPWFLMFPPVNTNQQHGFNHSFQAETGMGQNSTTKGTAGFSFHSPGFHFGYLFLTHRQVVREADFATIHGISLGSAAFRVERAWGGQLVARLQVHLPLIWQAGGGRKIGPDPGTTKRTQTGSSSREERIRVPDFSCSLVE